MRIRGRNLPYPILVSDPSPNSSTQRFLVLPTKASNTRGEPSSALLVKGDEKGLHPNGDLPFLDPHGLGNNSAKRDSQIVGPCSSNQAEGWKEEEEEKATIHESTNNGGAQANSRIPFPNGSSSQDQQKDSSKKPKRSSTALMEGSRCSRINGRGWRCSQPTLVGYSLCEHHLGKGRQKSLAGTGTGTVRGGQLGCTDQVKRNLSSHKPLSDESFRKKKARSISSLLGDQ